MPNCTFFVYGLPRLRKCRSGGPAIDEVPGYCYRARESNSGIAAKESHVLGTVELYKRTLKLLNQDTEVRELKRQRLLLLFTSQQLGLLQNCTLQDEQLRSGHADFRSL